MRLNVPMDDVIIMAVLQRQQYLSHVVAADSLRINEACCSPLDNFEAQVGTSHELEDHVEHTLKNEKKIEGFFSIGVKVSFFLSGHKYSVIFWIVTRIYTYDRLPLIKCLTFDIDTGYC